jgi:hypothetical protein
MAISPQPPTLARASLRASRAHTRKTLNSKIYKKYFGYFSIIKIACSKQPNQ